MAQTVGAPVGLLAVITEIRPPTHRVPMGTLMAIATLANPNTPPERVHKSPKSNRVHVVSINKAED